MGKDGKLWEIIPIIWELWELLWEIMGKLWEIMGNNGKLWEIMGNCGEMVGNDGKWDMGWEEMGRGKVCTAVPTCPLLGVGTEPALTPTLLFLHPTAPVGLLQLLGREFLPPHPYRGHRGWHCHLRGHCHLWGHLLPSQHRHRSLGTSCHPSLGTSCHPPLGTSCHPQVSPRCSRGGHRGAGVTRPWGFWGSLHPSLLLGGFAALDDLELLPPPPEVPEFGDMALPGPPAPEELPWAPESHLERGTDNPKPPGGRQRGS